MRNIFPCCTRQWDPFLHFACVHLLYHPFFLLFLYILSSLPSAGLSQSCYTEQNCVGSTVEASTARECCVETENGTSFGEAGNCAVTQCIGESRYRITICSLYLPVRKDLLMYFSLPTLHSHIQKPANRFLQILQDHYCKRKISPVYVHPSLRHYYAGFCGQQCLYLSKELWNSCGESDTQPVPQCKVSVGLGPAAVDTNFCSLGSTNTPRAHTHSIGVRRDALVAM